MVTFDGCADYVSIDFDRQCRTAATSHALSIYVQTNDKQHVLVGKYCMENWPRKLLLVRGWVTVTYVLLVGAGQRAALRVRDVGGRHCGRI